MKKREHSRRNRWGLEGKGRKKDRLRRILHLLHKRYPEATTSLNWSTPFELLVATVLSAQCTDVRVNMVTPELFRRFPTASDFASADQSELEELIRTTGFYRNKAHNIRSLAQDIVQKYGGEVPQTRESLIALAGVGRKTANVVLGNAFGIPAIAVDTHVTRLSGRLELTTVRDPELIERDLMELCPKEDWTFLSHGLILHGRAVCKARKPLCTDCPLRAECPFSEK